MPEPSRLPLVTRVTRLLPGLALTVGLAAAGGVLSAWLHPIVGRAAPDAIVLALVGGIALRAVREPGTVFEPGVLFSAREVLEWAIVLLGLSTDLRAFASTGAPLLAGIVGTVVVALAGGFLVGRAVGLSHAHALLVASGNAICGNSAIVAVAAVNGATREEVASSIAYTAVFGVAVVLALPLLSPLLQLTDLQYGIVTGLSVYAVPQVLAAAYPVSVAAGQTGMLVKLARVLLLGPVVLGVAMWERRRGLRTSAAAGGATYLPWFVVGFVLAAVVQTTGVVPAGLTAVAKSVSHWATIVSMAALGLAVDVRAIRRVGGRVAIAVTASLVMLLVLSIGLAVAVAPHART
ncbi:MAG: putative sulfate exporter family transporter [Gemmatimonadaceae bacterium]|nr:putative sulfate exporter family transporter [Gemmatimonadaceae bacterium]